MNESFYNNEMTQPWRLLQRGKTIDHRETFSYLWEFSGIDKGLCLGQTLVVGNYSSRSIQTNGPLNLMGTNDETEWYKIMEFKEPGIYAIPMALRAIRPRSAVGKKTRVVVFINAL